MKQTALFGLLVINSTFAFDLDIKSASCQGNDVVSVCALNRKAGVPMLKVDYKGYLRNGNVSVNIKLNDQEGFFPMSYYRGMDKFPAFIYIGDADYEKGIFFYARNEFGQTNNWDLELSFVDNEGRWDSRFGENYKFTFND